MTAKLLVAFLQCFTDHYVSVRIEVCIACSRLQITDEQVLDRLVDLATYDPIWKVKALAIQGQINCRFPLVHKPERAGSQNDPSSGKRQRLFRPLSRHVITMSLLLMVWLIES